MHTQYIIAIRRIISKVKNLFFFFWKVEYYFPQDNKKQCHTIQWATLTIIIIINKRPTNNDIINLIIIPLKLMLFC